MLHRLPLLTKWVHGSVSLGRSLICKCFGKSLPPAWSQLNPSSLGDLGREGLHKHRLRILVTQPLEMPPQKLREEIASCYRCYGHIFPSVIGWVVLLSLLPYFYIFLMPLLSHGLGERHGTLFVSLSVVSMLVMLVVSAYLYCLILNLSYQRIAHGACDLNEAKKKARDRHVQAIGGAAIGVITIFSVPFLVRVALSYGNAFLSFLALGFGFFAFIVLTTTLIIYLPLIILEEHNFLRAIPEAFNLAQDNLFRIFTLILFGWDLPLGLVHYLMHSLPSSVAVGGLWMAARSALMPLMFAVMVIVYMDLKAHRQLTTIQV